MATYYCKTTGDDALDGLSEANAWLTITKCVTTLVAGDIVYIAPGTYRNTAGWVCTNAGAAGNIIQYIGDPDCEQFENENPGYVRLTGCNAAELPACIGSVFDYNSKNYITLKNLIVDGTTNGVTIGVDCGGGVITERNVEDCIVFGALYGMYYGAATNVIAFGGFYAFHAVNADYCIAFGGNRGFAGLVQNHCISFASYYGYEMGVQSNCLAIGGLNGFFNGTNNNCIAIGGYYGFRFGTQNYCIAVGCWTAYQSCTLTACTAVYCNTTDVACAGASTPANHIGFTNLRMLINLAKWLKPDLFFEKDTGDDTILPAVTEDIMEQPRRMHDGTIDPGPFEYSDVEMDWVNFKKNPPGVKINRRGVQEFDLPAREGKQVKIRVWVKFNVTVGSEPQLILRGEGIAVQTDTATGDGSSFERLEVKVVPTKDTVLIVRLYQQDATAGTSATFSDMRIS